MKFYIRPILFIFILIVLALSYLLMSNNSNIRKIKLESYGVNAQSDFNSPVHIQIPNKLHTVNANSFGFNAELGVTGGAGGNYMHESYLRGTEKLPVYALRYPGGTTANFFDWSNEKLNPDTINSSGKKHMINALALDRKRNSGALTHVDLDSYLELVYKSDVKPFIVLNMLTSDIENIIQAITKLKKKYTKPVSWELGNELSNEEYTTKLNIKGGWNSEIYAHKSSIIANHINDQYPEDTIGAVASEIATGRHPTAYRNNSINKNRLLWDKTINSIPGIDAAIIHPYLFFKDKQRASLKKFDINDDTLLNSEWRWVFSCVQEIPEKYMQRMKERFPNKKIWITENGLLQNHRSDKALSEQHALLRTLTDAAYYISWMRSYPTLQVQMFHGLFLGRSWASALYPDYSYTANGVAYLLIQEALHKSKSIAWMDLQNSPVYYGVGMYSNTKVRALSGLYIKTDDSEKMLFVNSGPKNIMINTSNDRSRVISFGGDPEVVVTPGMVDEISDIGDTIVKGNDITIPKYSLVLIEKLSKS